MKALFVGDKWASNRPDFGPAIHEHIIIGSLESTGLATVDRLYVDEYHSLHGGAIPDDVLLDAADKADMILVCYSIGYPFLPSIDAFTKIRQSGKLVIFFWYDFVYKNNVHFVDQHLQESASQHVTFDIDCFDTAFPDKYQRLWAPYDMLLYKNNTGDRPIDVSFFGSLGEWPHRAKVIQELRDAGITVMTGFGQGSKDKIGTINDYVGALQQSKMTINFSHAGNLPRWCDHQAKGRIFEAMFCGAMLLESENGQIGRFFEQYVHYVPWTNTEDLISKIRYALDHDDIRRRIAEAGHRHAMNNFSANHFWNRVLAYR